MHADLSQISFKTLPSTDVKRNSSPTPVLNLKPYRCVSFRYGAGINSGLLPITRYPFPVNHSGTILPSDGESCYVLQTHRPYGSKDLDLLLKHRIPIKPCR